MAREQCECGPGDVESATYRFGSERCTFSRCQKCGREWTVTERVPDMGDVVTTDEILDVHALLEGNQSLKELIENA